MLFCFDGGIVNWISNQETELFSMFKSDLINKESLSKEDEEYYKEFEELLQFIKKIN